MVQLVSATTLRGTLAVKLSGTGTFTVDEEINQASTGVGKVVEYDSTNKILYYIQTRFNDEGVDSNGNLTAFSGANAITGQDSSVSVTPDTSTQTVTILHFLVDIILVKLTMTLMFFIKKIGCQ